MDWFILTYSFLYTITLNWYLVYLIKIGNYVVEWFNFLIILILWYRTSLFEKQNAHVKDILMQIVSFVLGYLMNYSALSACEIMKNGRKRGWRWSLMFSSLNLWFTFSCFCSQLFTVVLRFFLPLLLNYQSTWSKSEFVLVADKVDFYWEYRD